MCSSERRRISSTATVGSGAASGVVCSSERRRISLEGTEGVLGAALGAAAAGGTSAVSAGSSSAGAIVIVGAWTTMAGGDAGSAWVGIVAVNAESFDGLRSALLLPPLGPVPEGTLAAKAASFDMLWRGAGHTHAASRRSDRTCCDAQARIHLFDCACQSILARTGVGVVAVEV